MANKISQGTVVNAGMVIAGVDADTPPVTGSAPSGPATSVTDASFSQAASDGLAVVQNSRYDVLADWISYGTVGSYGTSGSRQRIVSEDTTTGSVHYLRYDPISRRIFALVSWHPDGGGVGPTLIENGFGDLTTDFSTEPFFSGYKYNNFTRVAPIGSYFPGIIGSRLTYEPEDLAGLGISWNGTSWGMTPVEAPAPVVYEYPIGGVGSVDPTNQTWRDTYAPAGYEFIPNYGFQSDEPLTNTSMMFEAVDMSTVDVTNLDMSEVVVASRMFKDAVGMDVTPSDLTGWDVSKVRDFHEMFRNTSFNQAIGGWTFSTDRTTPINDIVPSWTTQDPEVLIAGVGSNWVSPSSKVPNWDGTGINMQGMFEDNVAFNQDIGAWNVSAVFCMDQMFDDAKGFDNGGSPSIGNWDTSYVVDFFAMFRDAEGFSQDIGGWNVSNAIQIDSMFRETKSFSHNLNSWNTSNVKSMHSMFAYSDFNAAIGNWDTSSVTDMGEMFEEAYQFDQDIGSWNVSNVTDMNEMFQDAAAFNNGGSPSIGNWDTSSVTDMGEMFENAESFTQDISGWNVSSVTYSSQFDNGVAGNFPSPF